MKGRGCAHASLSWTSIKCTSFANSKIHSVPVRDKTFQHTYLLCFPVIPIIDPCQATHNWSQMSPVSDILFIHSDRCLGPSDHQLNNGGGWIDDLDKEDNYSDVWVSAFELLGVNSIKGYLQIWIFLDAGVLILLISPRCHLQHPLINANYFLMAPSDSIV